LIGYPALFQKAALIGVQPGCDSAEERRQRRWLEDSWIARLEDEGVSAFVDWWSQMPLFGPAREPQVLRAEEPHRWDHTQSGLVSALLVLGTSQMPSFWSKLPEIRCPIELWVGDLDTKFVRIAELMLQELPDACLHRFSQAHHNPLLDCPEEVETRLRTGLLA
jgi:2-succinyl-6-hydroxy-2,4-cyclohexadiene-1-carboxylate synthase